MNTDIDIPMYKFNPVLAYFLGLFTFILVFLIMYIFAIRFQSFRSFYTNIVCNFPG